MEHPLAMGVEAMRRAVMRPSMRWLPGWPIPRPIRCCAAPGRYHAFIDARLIRTMGPGDHFGELAARDWRGGYGYARLATVRCAEPGRLLKLTSEDFQWLIDTEPTIKARLAAILAKRLRQR